MDNIPRCTPVSSVVAMYYTPGQFYARLIFLSIYVQVYFQPGSKTNVVNFIPSSTPSLKLPRTLKYFYQYNLFYLDKILAHLRIFISHIFAVKINSKFYISHTLFNIIQFTIIFISSDIEVYILTSLYNLNNLNKKQ